LTPEELKREYSESKVEALRRKAALTSSLDALEETW